MNVSERSSILTSVIIVLILWFSQLDSTLAGGTDIECVPLKHCPFAQKLIKIDPFHPATVEFLRFTYCGSEDGEPKVWCNIFHYCITPDGNNGTCIPIKKCTSYVNLMLKVNISNPLQKNYLKAFRCTTEEDPDIKVCCPDTEQEEFPSQDDEISERFADLLPNPHLGECGVQEDDDRIVGGREAGLTEFPWMALLKYYNKARFQYACAGSLINGKNVLTAAHCVDSYITRSKGLGEIYSIILGEFDTRNETDCIYQRYGEDCADPPIEVFIESIRVHPGYKSAGTYKDDIAIIRLQRHVEYSDYIKPICLPEESLKLKGDETFALSGWGRTETEKRSPVKLKTTVPLNDNQNCSKLAKLNLTSKQLCAGAGDGRDNCFGDSGAPLMLEKRMSQRFVTFVAGIVSFGFGKSCGSYPGVYTFVPPYIDWIRDNIK